MPPKPKTDTDSTAAALMALTRTTSPLAALAAVKTWRNTLASYQPLEAERAKLTADREALAAEKGAIANAARKVEAEQRAIEETERRELCNEQIALGYEHPAASFDPLTRAIKAPWSTMSIADLRARVQSQRLMPKAMTPFKAPPSSMSGDGDAPTAKEIAACKAKGIDLGAFMKAKASMAATTIHNRSEKE